MIYVSEKDDFVMAEKAGNSYKDFSDCGLVPVAAGHAKYGFTHNKAKGKHHDTST